MIISLNYKHSHKCHFCGKNLATKENETYRNCYYIEKASHYGSIYHSARFHKITVAVPRCEYCSHVDTRISRINFLICVFIFSVSTYIWSGCFAETAHRNSRSWEDVLIACLPSFLIALFIGGAIAFLVRCLLEIKWNHNSNCDDYEPIKKLIRIGFEPRDSLPNLKNNNVQGKGSLNLSLLNEVIADIISNNNCTFIQKE